MAYTISKEDFDAVNTMCERHKNITMVGDQYLIRPFKDWFDFLKEGDTLHHFVYHYAVSRYSKGEDFLFAMRRIDEPETPYITLEFGVSGNLYQARMKYCRQVTEPDQLAFIQHFIDEILMPYVNNEHSKENE